MCLMKSNFNSQNLAKNRAKINEGNFAKNSTVTKEASNKHLLIMPEHTLSSQTH